MRRAPRRRPPWPVVAGAALAVLLLALPLVGLFERVDWSGLGADLTDAASLDALRLSLVSSVSAAALSVLLGTPLAWVLARASFPGRAVLRGLVLLPLVLPPVVGGVALLSAFSRRSPVGGWLYDTAGIQLTFSTAGTILAATFVALPFYVLTAEGALRALDPRYEEVAANLGAGRPATFWRVTLPLIGPSVAAGAALAWARALGEFGATITFAGNIAGRTRTLPLDIYLRLDSDPDAAAALSLLLVVVSLVVLVALRGRWFRTP